MRLDWPAGEGPTVQPIMDQEEVQSGTSSMSRPKLHSISAATSRFPRTVGCKSFGPKLRFC